jgi:hypothetical protein
MRIDLGRFAALDQPDDKRTENVTEKMKKYSEQCARVTENGPRPDVA